MKKGQELPAGTILMLSAGEYSGYGIIVIGKLLKPINETVWNEMNAALTKDGWFERHLALPWLLEHVYLEEMEYVELTMIDYGIPTDWECA